MPNKKIIYVSGLVNFETILNVPFFPVPYFPIDYPFFGINSSISGNAYNTSKALTKLGDEVHLSTHLGDDLLGKIIVEEIKKNRININHVIYDLDATPNNIVLVDAYKNTEMHCDLKNAQDVETDFKKEKSIIKKSDLVVLSNTNFNRNIIKEAKKLNKKIATDVHIIGSIEDEFNVDFMKYSDILFLSSKGLKGYNYEDFLLSLYNKYHNEIIVLGEGRDGAMVLDSKKREIYHIDAITLKDVTTTVGSRDALFSSFIHYYLKGWTPLNALKLAEVFTSYKLGFNGASEGFLKSSEVRKYYNQANFAVYKLKKF